MIGTLDIAQNTVSWMFDWGDVYGEEHFWSHKLAVVILIVYGCWLSFLFFCMAWYSCIWLYVISKAIRRNTQITSRWLLMNYNMFEFNNQRQTSYPIEETRSYVAK